MVMTEHSSSRRRFLRAAAGCGAASAAWLGGSDPLAQLLDLDWGNAVAEDLKDLIAAAPRARFWTSAAAEGVACSTCHQPTTIKGITEHQHDAHLVKCFLCARGCAIPEGDRGMCRARINVGGELRTLVYGRPISMHVDPIEKKPFYHFLPGARAFSMATSGCPLRCRFCQNWQISQARPEDYHSPGYPPDQIVRRARDETAPVIAFTYNEPTVFAEYLLDIARLGKKQGLRSVLISSGYMGREVLAEMCDLLDAVKIDLKGFSEDFYRRASEAELAPVLRSIAQIKKSGTHLELVNLVVPTLNDSEPMLRELAKWVIGELGPDVPVHFTRFHPDYKMLNLSPTPVATLERARAIAMEHGIRYAFVGNVPGHAGNQTYCYKCGKVVIERQGFFVTATHLAAGKCTWCGTPIAGVWA